MKSYNSIVLPLADLGRGDLSVAGGKGANLGELVRAGFPVPAGFAITTAAYDRFVGDNRLTETIGGELRDEPASGAAIRRAFEGAPIPPDVEQTILKAYKELGQGPVAVRSSATAEDLPEAAFAGQQDTFLNIVGPQALLDAVQRCWASLWTDRAIAYRQRQGLDQAAVKLAVVVQRMVAAEFAGVMFTANPVTGDRDEIVLDASPGLGEAVVSGLVTPDHFVFGKSSGRVKERRPGRREVIVRARPGGGTVQVDGSSSVGGLVLPEQALNQLALLGAAIEKHFGSPQDIEWAWAGEELFILQARPITALPEPLPHPSRLVQMLAGMFAEMFPIRPYPLDLSTWVPAISEAAVEPIFSLIGFDVPPLEQLFDVVDGVVIRYNGKLAFRLTAGILLAPGRLLWLALRYNPIHARNDPQLVEARRRARALESLDLGVHSWDGLLAIVQEALELPLPLAGTPRRHYYPRAFLAAGLLRIVLGLLRRGDRFNALLSGAESMTLVANRALEGLAARIRSEPVLADIFARNDSGELSSTGRQALEARPEGRSFLEELRTFMDRYGHREVVLSTSLQPTWKDAPEVVLGLIKGFAISEPRRESRKPEWEAARDNLLAHPLLRIPPVCSAILSLLTMARCLWRIREDSHYDATLILPVLRRTLLELGRRLAAVGVLEAPEDIFHLKLGELEQIKGAWPPPAGLASELRAAAFRRKARRAELEGTPVVNAQLYRQAGQKVDGQEDVLLRGTPGSAGVAEGPARIIHDSAEFGKLRAGEVLVAPYTNPAWTPLFQRAAAVVVDGGAAGSHAAIVAREYDVPAVMGTVEGTRVLTDGEWVRVDGTRGLVFRIAAKTVNMVISTPPGF